MIRIEHVSKSFKGNKAVSDLNLQIKKSEIIGLLGANGAGKSTTINMILGFINPDSGQIFIDNVDITKSIKEVRKSIGYIPEDVNLYSYMSGLENLDYFCRLAGINYKDDELHDILSKCGLNTEAHKKKVGEYSKGMRQKVGIAIAYAKKAKVYLLDEPASGLDPLASNELSALLKKLAEDGATILMASHDIFRVREVCDRIGILKKGQLVKELRSEEVNTTQLEQLYLQYMQS